MYILSKLPIVYVTKHEKNFTYAVSYHSFQKFLSTNEHFLPLKDVSLLSSYRSTNFFIWQFHIVINEDKLISLYTIFPIPDNLSIFFSKYLEKNIDKLSGIGKIVYSEINLSSFMTMWNCHIKKFVER